MHSPRPKANVTVAKFGPLILNIYHIIMLELLLRLIDFNFNVIMVTFLPASVARVITATTIFELFADLSELIDFETGPND
jgi:hypothetical protein